MLLSFEGIPTSEINENALVNYLKRVRPLRILLFSMKLMLQEVAGFRDLKEFCYRFHDAKYKKAISEAFKESPINTRQRDDATQVVFN